MFGSTYLSNLFRNITFFSCNTEFIENSLGPVHTRCSETELGKMPYLISVQFSPTTNNLVMCNEKKSMASMNFVKNKMQTVLCLGSRILVLLSSYCTDP